MFLIMLNSTNIRSLSNMEMMVIAGDKKSGWARLVLLINMFRTKVSSSSKYTSSSMMVILKHVLSSVVVSRRDNSSNL